jgi:hypothetical protein
MVVRLNGNQPPEMDVKTIKCLAIAAFHYQGSGNPADESSGSVQPCFFRKAKSPRSRGQKSG